MNNNFYFIENGKFYHGKDSLSFKELLFKINNSWLENPLPLGCVTCTPLLRTQINFTAYVVYSNNWHYSLTPQLTWEFSNKENDQLYNLVEPWYNLWLKGPTNWHDIKGMYLYKLV